MVEVFKTNVTEKRTAANLVRQLEAKFVGCKANFDLEDCDLILRVQFNDTMCDVTTVISVLKENGFFAEVLADEWSTE